MRPVRLKSISQKKIGQFQEEIWQYYVDNKRDFPWRRPEHYVDPYKILVSEMMLQQTQAGRVVEKYISFLNRFPTLAALDKASVAEVITVWRGLGYNRRAIALKKIATIAGERWGHKIPRLSVEELDALPHIGYATACSISAFAWDIPVSFIETNIRRVFIHHFFQGQEGVSDKDILALVQRTLPDSRSAQGKDRHLVQDTGSRQWYYALMDYGSMLKMQVENPNRRSVGYKRQSNFAGSNRQVRGAILTALAAPFRAGGCTVDVLLSEVRQCIASQKNVKRSTQIIRVTKKDIELNVEAMKKEGFLFISGNIVSLAKS